MKRSVRMAATILAMFSVNAGAQLVVPGNTTATFLGTVPENPVAGQPFLIRATFGPCEAISVDPNDAVLVGSDGTALTIQVPGVFSGNCSVQVRDALYSLPAILEPGTYTVAVQFNDAGTIGRMGTRLVTVVSPTSAVQGQAKAIPLMGTAGLLFLAVGIFFVMIHQRRLKSRV